MRCPDSYLIDPLIKKGLPMVIYKSPGAENSVLIVQRSSGLSKISIEDLEDKSGFVIAAFNSTRNNEIFLLKPDFIQRGGDNPYELEKYIASLSDARSSNGNINYQHSRNEYLEKAEFCIDKIRSGALKKIVLSRVLIKDVPVSLNYGELFKALCLKYNDAFVYMLHSPETGIWTGATPETLLKKDNNKLETMAIAGTRLLSECENKPGWGEKEIEEQKLVSVFIEDLLLESGITEYEVKGPETIAAGKIAHLKTTFSIDQKQLKGQGR